MWAFPPDLLLIKIVILYALLAAWDQSFVIEGLSFLRRSYRTVMIRDLGKCPLLRGCR